MAFLVVERRKRNGESDGLDNIEEYDGVDMD